MPFDLSTAKPVSTGFDLSTAKPVQASQPSIMQTIAASPIGRFAHDAVLPVLQGAAGTGADILNTVLNPLQAINSPNAPSVSAMINKTVNATIQPAYSAAIDAQKNRPGYAQARAADDAMLAKSPSGLSDQTIAPFAPTLAGVAGLVTGGLNGMNAAADAQTASQNDFQQRHPVLSTGAQIAGGLMAMPEGGPKPFPAPAQAPPTLAALNTAKKAAYSAVDNSSMKIAGPEIQNLAASIQTKLDRMGLNQQTMPKLAPKVATAMDSLSDAGSADQTLQGMDIQRRIAGIAAGSQDKTERTAARIVQDGIDDFITNLQPNQLSGPIDQTAINALPQARDLASRSFKAQQLQSIIDKAQNNSTGFSQSGYENALRGGFRKLLNNDRAISRFNPGEVAAIKQVATGGNALSATNLLRQVGKLSPQGAIPILAEIGAYGAMGPQALAIPAVGIAGRTGATILQSAAAKRAVGLALNGKAIASSLPLNLPSLTGASRLPLGLSGMLPRLQPQSQ